MAEVAIRFSADPVFKRAMATRHGAEGVFYRDDLPAGTSRFDYDDKILSFVCPCGCAMVHQVAIYAEGQPAHGWKWNGNHERPTLSPSIAITTGCHWHGHLVDGAFKD
jgi:hypothetical protein